MIPGTHGVADEVVKAFLNDTLQYDPNEICHHHDHEEGHECHHEHGCKDHYTDWFFSVFDKNRKKTECRTDLLLNVIE